MSDIWSWLEEHSQLVSALASVAMTIIWIVYLQIALTTYMRQRRPRLVIDQGHGRGLGSSFMLINLSQEPVHISCILVAFNVGSNEEVFEITDFEHSAVESEADSPRRWEESLKYGPVDAGSFLILGPSSSMLSEESVSLRQVNSEGGKSLEDRFGEQSGDILDFELRVVGIFSTDDQAVGARRRYQIVRGEDGQARLRSMNSYTDQLTSRRDQATLRDWNDHCLCA